VSSFLFFGGFEIWFALSTPQESEEWWRGSLDGKTGVFPANYVEQLEEGHRPKARYEGQGNFDHDNSLKEAKGGHRSRNRDHTDRDKDRESSRRKRRGKGEGSSRRRRRNDDDSDDEYDFEPKSRGRRGNSRRRRK
jgi:hypothetical protein